MSEHPHTHTDLQEIYYQASEWIRMCNNITWNMGTFLVPLAIGCVPIVIQYPKHRFVLAPASIFLFAFWVYVSKLYRASAVSTRKVLMEIEREWGVKEDLALYNSHGQVGLSRLGLFTTQLICLAVLAVVWIVLLALLSWSGAAPPANPPV